MDTDFSDLLKQCRTTEDRLKTIQTILNTQRRLPRADQLWGGADVVISYRPHPHDGESSFYPAPRMVYSRHAKEVSWFFEALRDAFYLESLVDCCSKIEFFGRLANTANRKTAENPHVSARELCSAVFNEAVVMYSEIKRHEFNFLLISTGGKIADDFVPRCRS